MQSGFSIDPLSGLLRQARQVLSPHCDERPPGVVPELIVVHGISLPPGEFGGPWIEQLFTALWSNEDDANHAAAERLLEGRYTWLEEGIIDPSGEGPMIAEQPEQVKTS